MKILGVVCSPRLEGNTEILVQEVLDSAKENGAEVDLVTLAGKSIKFCDACEACVTAGECTIEDDMQDIYEKMVLSDGIVFGSPVYFRTVSGQAKTLIDRLACFIPSKKLRDKVGGIVVVSQRAGNTAAVAVFDHVFNGLRMVYAGSTMAYGYAKGDVRKDKRGMAEARALGRVMVRYISRNQLIDRSRNIEKAVALPPRIISGPSAEETDGIW